MDLADDVEQLSLEDTSSEEEEDQWYSSYNPNYAAEEDDEHNDQYGPLSADNNEEDEDEDGSEGISSSEDEEFVTSKRATKTNRTKSKMREEIISCPAFQKIPPHILLYNVFPFIVNPYSSSSTSTSTSSSSATGFGDLWWYTVLCSFKSAAEGQFRSPFQQRQIELGLVSDPKNKKRSSKYDEFDKSQKKKKKKNRRATAKEREHKKKLRQDEDASLHPIYALQLVCRSWRDLILQYRTRVAIRFAISNRFGSAISSSTSARDRVARRHRHKPASEISFGFDSAPPLEVAKRSAQEYLYQLSAATRSKPLPPQVDGDQHHPNGNKSNKNNNNNNNNNKLNNKGKKNNKAKPLVSHSNRNNNNNNKNKKNGDDDHRAVDSVIGPASLRIVMTQSSGKGISSFRGLDQFASSLVSLELIFQDDRFDDILGASLATLTSLTGLSLTMQFKNGQEIDLSAQTRLRSLRLATSLAENEIRLNLPASPSLPLRCLYFDRIQVSDEWLSETIPRLPELDTLQLFRGSKTDTMAPNALETWGLEDRKSTLTCLSLVNFEQIADELLGAMLLQLQLKYLRLQSCPTLSKPVITIGGQHNNGGGPSLLLDELHMTDSARFSPTIVFPSSAFGFLQCLDLSGTGVDDDWLEQFHETGGIHRVRRLFLSRCRKLTSIRIASRSLVELDLAMCLELSTVTLATVDKEGGAVNQRLRIVDLSGSKLDDSVENGYNKSNLKLQIVHGLDGTSQVVNRLSNQFIRQNRIFLTTAPALREVWMRNVPEIFYNTDEAVYGSKHEKRTNNKKKNTAAATTNANANNINPLTLQELSILLDRFRMARHI